MTDIQSRYSFRMVEQDHDTGEVTCEVDRRVMSDNLDDLVHAFLFFLWNAGYTYVEGVTVKKINGGEVTTA